jgi:hypothetical protein
MALHVSHEMERLLRIGELRRRWGWLLRWWPFDTVTRGLRVAYASHARALLEFYHDGRPGKVGQRQRQGGDLDVWLGDYTGTVGAHPWAVSPSHEPRLRDADKLVGHLSTGRLEPARAHLDEWGDAQDRSRFRPIIEQIMLEVPNAATLFPGTDRALRETRS